MFRTVSIIMIFGLLLVCGTAVFAQSADNRTPVFGKADDDRPSNIKESLEKMRIDREKKEYNEMLERGEEALRLSEQLEKAYAANGKLTGTEYAKIASVEKIVKKIRSELGGDDDDKDDEEKDAIKDQLHNPGEALRSLRSTTVALFDELKKTTRFTISAAAIQTSNAVLKIARFLRITN